MFSLISNKHGACKFGFESVDVCVFCENETVKMIKVFSRTVHRRTLEKRFFEIVDSETRNKGKRQLSERMSTIEDESSGVKHYNNCYIQCVL